MNKPVCRMVKTLFIFVAILSGSCKNYSENSGNSGADKASDDLLRPKIEFAETEHDFGQVIDGEKVGWYFYYKNTGESDLIILNARASCGCTVADYERKPLPPGGEGKLKVIYDSSGRKGKEIKQVKVETNAENSFVQLQLEVEVFEKSNL